MVDFPPPAFPNTATRFIRQRSLTLQEPQIERCEHQDYSDVHHQPFPEPVPEEQDVHADNDGDKREHVKHDDCLSFHSALLVRAAERSQRHAWIADEIFEQCPLWVKSGGKTAPLSLSASASKADIGGQTSAGPLCANY